MKKVRFRRVPPPPPPPSRQPPKPDDITTSAILRALETEEGDANVLPELPPPPSPVKRARGMRSEGRLPQPDELPEPLLPLPHPAAPPAPLPAPSSRPRSDAAREPEQSPPPPAMALEPVVPGRRPARAWAWAVPAGLVAGYLAWPSSPDQEHGAAASALGATSASSVPSAAAPRASAQSESQPGLAPAADAPQPAPRRGGLGECQALAVGTELASGTWRNVTPQLGPAGDGKFRVGFAHSALRAVGLEVDTASLASREVFTDDRAPYLSRVVPAPDGFYPVRFASPLSQATVVPGPRPFTLGLTTHGMGVVYFEGGGAFHWPIPKATTTTVPVVATSRSGYDVVFRVISRPSQIRYGRLDLAGNKASELRELASGSVKSPAVASLGEETVVGYLERRREAWNVRLVRVGEGRTSESVAFPLTESGDVHSLALASVDDDTIALQWAQGQPTVLRAQLAARDLKPAGEPLVVSDSRHSVESSALMMEGRELVSVYTEGSALALRASVFRCR